MRTTIINCDICGEEMKQRSWEEEPRRFSVQTNCISQNPMAKITNDSKHQENSFNAPDTCQFCMKKLATVIAETILSIREEKNH
jgi:hypothetical protein